jgi:hypothetical protein
MRHSAYARLHFCTLNSCKIHGARIVLVPMMRTKNSTMGFEVAPGIYYVATHQPLERE